jgi:hypothetical protein
MAIREEKNNREPNTSQLYIKKNEESKSKRNMID